MPKFNFQLEGVLKHRKHIEQLRQRTLAEAQSAMTQLQAQLRQLDESVRRAGSDLRQNHLTGRLDLDYLAAHRRFTLASQRQALALAQKMALVQRQVLEAQSALAHAAKQRKVIEKLRERHHERWSTALGRRELTEQDEIAMQLSYWHGIELEEAEPVG
ncbi:MAG: flagellar export protein FliJ [Phycisphaerales bacterium]|jgi:flagellar FliJ protein|nr:flagellar export protein FliJ [Phycisphaerales bacterium]